MEYKLTKTFLSKKFTRHSFLAGVIGLSLLTLFFGADQNNFSASGLLVFEKKEYWRAFTTSLLHADLTHLAHNAFFFTGLSALLFNYFGFWVFPLLTVFVGGFINMATLWFYPPQVHLVGISGVIYFMASFWLTLFILIEKRQSLKARLIYSVGISLIFLFPEAFEARTSYLAHGMGFLFGVPSAILYYLVQRKEILAEEVWVPVVKVRDPMEDIILLEENSYHLVQPEEPSPSSTCEDSSRCPSH